MCRRHRRAYCPLHREGALIADLSAGFRVERSHVEHDLAIDASRQFIDELVVTNSAMTFA